MSFNNEIQETVFNVVRKSLPLKIDSGSIVVEDGPSYSWSPVRTHDYDS